MRRFANYAFIDAQNLYSGTRARGWELDYSKFRHYLATKYAVAKAFMFFGYLQENEPLYAHLRSVGYELIFKPVPPRREGAEVKGNIDVEMVLHAMIEYPNYRKAVIVSNDGDFFSLIEYLARHKKLLKIIVPNERYSTLIGMYEKFVTRLYYARKQLEKSERDSDGRTKLLTMHH
jgi:uncharacterized LabA/DUF88 family protein